MGFPPAVYAAVKEGCVGVPTKQLAWQRPLLQHPLLSHPPLISSRFLLFCCLLPYPSSEDTPNAFLHLIPSVLPTVPPSISVLSSFPSDLPQCTLRLQTRAPTFCDSYVLYSHSDPVFSSPSLSLCYPSYSIRHPCYSLDLSSDISPRPGGALVDKLLAGLDKLLRGQHPLRQERRRLPRRRHGLPYPLRQGQHGWLLRLLFGVGTILLAGGIVCM